MLLTMVMAVVSYVFAVTTQPPYGWTTVLTSLTTFVLCGFTAGAASYVWFDSLSDESERE